MPEAPPAIRPTPNPPRPKTSPLTGNYAGKVEGTDAFVAVIVDGENHVLAYLCDGDVEGEAATVAEWFRGALADDGSLDLSSDGGARLVASVAADGARGTVTLPDGEEEHAFSSAPVEEPAGLYRAEETVDGEEYVGGWILLSNGEERGAVKSRSSGVFGQDIGLARPSEPVDGFTKQGIDI